MLLVFNTDAKVKSCTSALGYVLHVKQGNAKDTVLFAMDIEGGNRTEAMLLFPVLFQNASIWMVPVGTPYAAS